MVVNLAYHWVYVLETDKVDGKAYLMGFVAESTTAVVLELLMDEKLVVM